MPLKKLTEDVENISKLADEPNDVGGMSAAELKAAFDKAGADIKRYLNESLVAELDQNFEGLVLEDKRLADAIAELVDFSVPDASITEAKLADNAVTHAKLGLNAVESANIKDGAVGENELAVGAVSAGKIQKGAVTSAKLGKNAVDQNAMGLDAVWNNNIKDGAVGESKLSDGAVSVRTIADGSVGTAKIADNAVTKEYKAKLSVAGWNGGKTQTVSVPGLKAKSIVTVDIDCTGIDGDPLKALNEAWGKVLKADKQNGSVTVVMDETPEVEIPLKIKEELK